ncbi:PhoX domain-containing protein [Vararia minispora EC-137]|uniref:PhoX domain-containing protein n=1 Tax=Vararia minispora EC-137 TaxID=1314806 RepID=A0ACB8QQN8_9AGAM|nr:PhoX domain-containing protein [Vararia minispora EC-137]
MKSFSLFYATLVAVVAIALPVTWRIVSSPFTFVLLSPVIFTIFGFLCLLLPLVIGYYLDSKSRHPSSSGWSARPLAFSTPAAWQAVLTRSQWSFKPPQTLPPIHPDSPMISAAVNDILIMIVRDFILVWYKDISSSPSFPTAVSATMHASLESIIAMLEPLDLPSIIVKRVLPKITAHVELFRESEVALRGAGLERRLTESEELDMLLAARYASKGGGKLHPAVENLSSSFTKQSEEVHLKHLVDRALPYVLPVEEAQSTAVKIVVREIIACCVLYPAMEMLSDPDFWNQKIDSLAGAAIRQQRLVSKVRNVLEAQLPSRPEAKVPVTTTPTPETITVRTDPRQFESFLRSISRTSSLLDARRLKNDIMGEIRRTRVLLANHERDDWINGEKTEDVVAFLDRLYTAKRTAEERIVVLGGHEYTARQSITAEPSPLVRITLRDVLGNPNSLSYFMEFLDRHDRSLLVQFWLTVESFKNPLEPVDSDSDNEADPSSESTISREDITMIYELYFSSNSPHPALSAVTPKNSSTIRDFANSEDHETPAFLRKARRCVIRAQQEVEQAMEQDFEEFERSELWFRVIEDISSSHSVIASGSGPRAKGPPSPVAKPPRLPPPLSRANSSSSFLHTFSVPPTSPLPYKLPTPPVSSSSIQSAKTAPTGLDLLMSPVSETELRGSRAPLFDDPDDASQDSYEKQSTVAAIQAALTDIIALDNQQSEHRRPSQTPNNDLFGTLSDLPESSHSQARRTFSEDNAAVDGDDGGESKRGEFHAAGPGDLQLSYEIARLSNKLSALQTQDAMLDTLIKKADLSGDTQELQLLRRSKSALTREMREIAFQRTQYEQQDVANRLIPERTRLSIVNSTQAEESGKAVVRYLVEVQQLAPDGTVATGWVVARRYNEFLSMHNKLRERFTMVRGLEFPRKQLVTSLSASFVDTRRAALEKYIQNLVLISAVCESEELRAFLSRNSPFIVTEPEPNAAAAKARLGVPGTNLVRSMYHTVAESIDDMFFGPSMLDVMIQRLTRQAAELAGIIGTSVNDEDAVAQALRASDKSASADALLHLTGDLKLFEGETSTSAFTAPISDFILAVFELNKKNNWLRRQAIVVILQQVLGSTVERKIRETINIFLDEPHLMSFISVFKDGFWPGGKFKPPGVPRALEEKLRTRDDANRKLSALVPGASFITAVCRNLIPSLDLAANMIGRSNARRGARRIFAVLQNRRLNQHIVYTVLDEVNCLAPFNV